MCRSSHSQCVSHPQSVDLLTPSLSVLHTAFLSLSPCYTPFLSLTIYVTHRSFYSQCVDLILSVCLTISLLTFSLPVCPCYTPLFCLSVCVTHRFSLSQSVLHTVLVTLYVTHRSFHSLCVDLLILSVCLTISLLTFSLPVYPCYTPLFLLPADTYIPSFCLTHTDEGWGAFCSTQLYHAQWNSF